MAGGPLGRLAGGVEGRAPGFRKSALMAVGESLDWEAVRRAYLRGDYSRCSELLQAAPDCAEVQIFLARIESRQGREWEALRRLLAVRTPDPQLAAERDIWAASNYYPSGEFALAHQMLDRALHVLRSPMEAYYRAHHVRALAYFVARDYDASWNAVSVLLESPSLLDRAQGYALRSWIFAKRDLNLRAQVRDLVTSLELYEQIEEPDQLTFVRTVGSLAALCREIPTERLTELVHRSARRVQSNEATAFQLFQLTRILGWIDALQGDEISAMRRWRDAEENAPTPFWRVFCLVDRAFLAGAMGRKEASRDLLASANREAAQLSWSSTQNEERLILLTIAQLLAPHDPARAQRYLATFRSLTTQAHAQMAFVHDLRARALQLYPQGTALLHLGERDDAVAMLKEAYDIFARFEYGWRAALAAIGLFEATNERAWLQRAREHIAPWPNSWIARNV